MNFFFKPHSHKSMHFKYLQVLFCGHDEVILLCSVKMSAVDESEISGCSFIDIKVFYVLLGQYRPNFLGP